MIKGIGIRGLKKNNKKKSQSSISARNQQDRMLRISVYVGEILDKGLFQLVALYCSTSSTFNLEKVGLEVWLGLQFKLNK